ncbi:MAG: 2-hydroxyglutaryl-CoA dehydratase, partial [Desulfovibrionaceae bacterium]|nr:2-hydroxyglutaryl-CoA dehydratase [Desulfovibrionaceae bacterium]
HTFANNRLAETVVAEGGEVILPDILDFFLYCLYDDIYRYRRLAGTLGSAFKSQIFRRVIEWYRKPVLTALQGSVRFETPTPFDDMVRLARGWVSLGHQAGEGWLLTAEMVKYLESGVDNIICVQPFGCLPNHITGKGMFRELKRRYPHANIVAIDYDQGTSEANQVNRIKLMMDTARRSAA